MVPIGLILPADDMPRTEFYERLRGCVQDHPWFRQEAARLVIPAEDTAQETNWPRYGNPASAYVRGSRPDLKPDGVLTRYLNAIVRHAQAHPEQRVLVINMHPFVRLPQILKPFANIVVADGSLAGFERSLNPRTLSMPALPIVRPARSEPVERTILASFQGAPSHPVRTALAAVHDGRDIIVNLIDPKNHLGRIDATAGRTDTGYEDLLDRSVFSFVPRGDALFSYRLLEVMARGSIPVILSDGWVLPFDRTVDWPSLSVRVQHDAVAQIPAILRAFSSADVDLLQTNLRLTYEAVFADLDRIVARMIDEAAALPW